MNRESSRLLCLITLVWLSVLLSPGTSHANDVWLTPTSQQDVGGLEIASNSFWPVTPAGAVRFVWATPSDLTDLLSAKVAIIPGGIDSGSFLNLFVCPADNNGAVAGACVGPLPTIFSGTPNKLTEVDVSLSLMPHVGDPGFTYVAILAYTTPTTSTDHIVGLRMTYHAPNPTLAANTFFGTQTAPLFSGSFAGNGAGLTNLPVPAGAATLGANTFTGVQTAPGFSGSGAGLTDVARLTANTFTGTQRITSGNLSLDASTALTTGNLMKDGQFFLHTLGSPGNTYLGLSSGVFSSGGGNTGIGSSALQQNTLGFGNTAVGNDALGGNTTGASNIAVGTNAGFTQTTGSNNIYLGNQIRGVVGESSTMYLGAGMDPLFGTPITKAFIGGVRGTTTGVANAVPVVIDSNGQLGTVSSSIRFKEDVHDMAGASERLLKLRPVTFHYTQAYADGSKPVQYGLIAEEVADVFPELAVRDAHGIAETVHYETLSVLLLNELKKAHDEAQRQNQRIERLEKRLAAIERERTKVPDSPR